jgi:hypothetical protein
MQFKGKDYQQPINMKDDRVKEMVIFGHPFIAADNPICFHKGTDIMTLKGCNLIKHVSLTLADGPGSSVTDEYFLSDDEASELVGYVSSRTQTGHRPDRHSQFENESGTHVLTVSSPNTRRW